MSNELYYRGSEEYAVAVKNQLRRMELQGIHDTNKIAFSIQNMEYGIRTDIRKSTYAIVASQEMLRQTFNQGFDSINNTLELGFGNMSAKLSEVKEAIYQVGDKICSRLDEINDIVNNPLLTASREFYRRALKNYQNGYYADALEAIKQAVEKNKTDYISWQLMGEIYLYGAGKYDNVINLDEAEKAFENAAKYIDADLKDSDDAKQLGMIIYYELGYTRFLQSNDLLVWGNESESIEMLSKSEESFLISAGHFNDYYINHVSDYNFEEQEEEHAYDAFFRNKIFLSLAKDKHFQGNDDIALNYISQAINADSNNALIFSTDKDFESIWGKIENLIEEKRKFLIANIEEIRNKISELEFTHEKINSFLSEYDSLTTGYKDAPYLSLVEIIKNPKWVNFYDEKKEQIDIIKKIEEVRNKISELEFSQEKKNLVLSEYDSITDGYKDAPYLSLVKIIRNPKWVNFYDEKKEQIDTAKEIINDLTITFDALPKKLVYQEKDVFGRNCIGNLKNDDLITISKYDAASLYNVVAEDDHIVKDNIFYVKCPEKGRAYLEKIKKTSSFRMKKTEDNKFHGSFRAFVECIKDDLDKQVKIYNIKGIKELSDALTNYIEIFNKEDKKDKNLTRAKYIAAVSFSVLVVLIGIIRCVA